MRKLSALGIATFAALSLGSQCNKGDGDDEKPTHPGCPGESSRSDDDAVSCTCGPNQLLQAGSLRCKECDPTTSRGVYCDCGQKKLFSMNDSFDQHLGIGSPPVQCAPDANLDAPCPDGRYPSGDQCVKCGPRDCGLCGACGAGATCISGQCVSALACRVRVVYPYCEAVPHIDEDGILVPTTECIEESACDFGKANQCAFTLSGTIDLRPGDECGCDQDSRGCVYGGVTELLSQ